MEAIVDEVLQDMLRHPDKYTFSCTCEACMDSIRAIALNKIKPFYVTTRKGEVYGTYCNGEVQNKVNVLSEILRAKKIVEESPEHAEQD